MLFSPSCGPKHWKRDHCKKRRIRTYRDSRDVYAESRPHQDMVKQWPPDHEFERANCEVLSIVGVRKQHSNADGIIYADGEVSIHRIDNGLGNETWQRDLFYVCECFACMTCGDQKRSLDAL
ncbi:hypothetical protein STEG23_036864, partial [Scotinomys teguina]